MKIGSRLIFFVAVTGHVAPLYGSGGSPSDAAVVGESVSGIIECGEGYTSHELYDTKITLLEFLRAEKAWREISNRNGANQPPAAGYDYVLARIRFEYDARGRPGNCVHTVRKSHFSALSRNGDSYPNPEVTVPQPELSGPLKSGDSITGWIALQVAREDTTPLMTFSVDDAGAVQHGGKLWFKLH